MKICRTCNKIYTDFDNYCLNCNRPLENYSDEECYERQKQQREINNLNKPKCPTCGSTNIKRISDVRKAAHALTFGLFSATARSQFECLNCHYKW